MPVEVQLPQMLRRYANGSVAVRVSGGTVGESLADLDRAYTGLRGQLLTREGNLHRFVNVYVNQEDVRFLKELETRVADGDLVTILPAVAGGGPVLAGGPPAGAGGARPWLPPVAGRPSAGPAGRRRMGRV